MLLQVLRVRDAPAAPARARRGARNPRPGCRPPPGQGAAGAHRRAARAQRRGGGQARRARASPTSPPTSSGCASRALERGLLPHTNLGVLDRADLGRLRAVTASQGLMLESVAERLMETVHAGSPTKHPAMRMQTIDAAGELKIPFTSGILVGIGETEEERMASLAALADGARAPRPPPGGHPPELRPAPELLRPGARRHRGGRRRRVLAHRGRAWPAAAMLRSGRPRSPWTT